MATSAIDEILRQHVFIEAWLAGRPDTSWDAFETSLDTGFSMVAPDGTVTARGELLDGFRPAFGAVPELTIEIRNAAVVDATPERVTVRYEEWQSAPEANNRRVSTAVLGPDPAAPIGWAWISLHETWLPSEG